VRLCVCAPVLTYACLSAQQQMCLLLRESMTVGKIALAREFFSNELGAGAAKVRIKDELSSYCVVTEAPKTTFGKARCSTFSFDTDCALILCLPLAGAPNVHWQTLRQTGRPVHRHPTEPDRVPEVLSGIQVPQLPRSRLPHAQWPRVSSA